MTHPSFYIDGSDWFWSVIAITVASRSTPPGAGVGSAFVLALPETYVMNGFGKGTTSVVPLPVENVSAL
jgi:hypothetical protein